MDFDLVLVMHSIRSGAKFQTSMAEKVIYMGNLARVDAIGGSADAYVMSPHCAGAIQKCLTGSSNAIPPLAAAGPSPHAMGPPPLPEF